jgi:hypothetical protein
VGTWTLVRLVLVVLLTTLAVLLALWLLYQLLAIVEWGILALFLAVALNRPSTGWPPPGAARRRHPADVPRRARRRGRNRRSGRAPDVRAGDGAGPRAPAAGRADGRGPEDSGPARPRRPRDRPAPRAGRDPRSARRRPRLGPHGGREHDQRGHGRAEHPRARLLLPPRRSRSRRGIGGPASGGPSAEARRLLEQSSAAISGYVRGNLAIGAIAGLSALAGMLVLGIPTRCHSRSCSR